MTDVTQKQSHKEGVKTMNKEDDLAALLFACFLSGVAAFVLIVFCWFMQSPFDPLN